MPDLDEHEEARRRGARSDDRAAPSRRSVLRVAAGASAAGIAASMLGGVLAPASAVTHTDTSASTGAATFDDGANDVVLHVRDAAAGEIDVFRGTTQTRLRDRDLAARVVRAGR
jgi:hypothetical protein